MTLKLNGKTSLFGPPRFYRTSLAIALPVMAQLLIQNMVSLIDNFMVAGLGDIKMSGVNVSGQVNFIYLVLIGALCSSGGIFMSQYNGAHDSEGMRQTFRFKLIVCLLTGAIYTALCLTIPEKLVSFMVRGNTQSGPIIEQGAAYMRIIAYTWIPTAISTVIGSSLRETGNVKPPLVISVIATVVNTFFNWLFIYGNLGAPRLEVTGAAVATIIARVVEAGIFIIYFYRVKPAFFIRLASLFRISLNFFGSIFSRSVLILISELTWVITETVTTALYNSRGGADIVSGMAAGFAIANLFFVCFNGIYVSTGVVLGGTLGADNLKEAKKQAKWLLSGAVLFGIAAGVMGCFTTLLIPLVYGNLSYAARNISRGLVLISAVYMPVWAFVNTQFAISRTGGDTVMGVAVDVSVNALLFLPGMFLLTFFTSLGPVEMYAIVKLSDFVKIAIAAVWLRKERWLKNLTARKY